MIASTDHKLYQKLQKAADKKGGSILKNIRTCKGGGKGLIAGAIVLLVFTVPITILGFVTNADTIVPVLLSVPGLLLLILGIVLRNKRNAGWVSYYQKESGFSETELQQVDRELSSPSTTIAVCRYPGTVKDSYIAAFFTEHYLVLNGGIEPYLWRLDDMIAAGFSDSGDIWCMALLTVHDKETRGINCLITDTDKKPALANEILQELSRRNPKILCGQELVCDGRHYILERDGAQLLRLHQEGHTLETA